MLKNYKKCLSWKQTNKFIALHNNGKYALYSLKQEKLTTDFIFDKITYIPVENCFVVKNAGVVYLIYTEGNKLSATVTCPNNFNMEGLLHYVHSVSILYTDLYYLDLIYRAKTVVFSLKILYLLSLITRRSLVQIQLPQPIDISEF